MRLTITSAYSRTRPREEQAEKLVPAGRLVDTYQNVLTVVAGSGACGATFSWLEGLPVTQEVSQQRSNRPIAAR